MSNVEPTGTGNVQYDRWNEDNINMNVEASQSTRIYDRACTGTTGILVKAAAAVVGAVLVFVIGYVTGYYVHRC
uniref:Small integral membrane protein 1 n=1 Tax=Acanthochromis polyacanthus TaxID=80966 RepID=A0A3Q1FP11_9TELE